MQALPILKALADEARLRLVYTLEHGSFNVQELTTILGLSQPTVSHHLRILERAELIRCDRAGTWAYYSLTRNSSASIGSILKSTLESLNGEPFASDLRTLNRLQNDRRDDAKRYFESVADSWNMLRDQNTQIDSMLSQLSKQIPSDGVFIDMGCGSGALLKRLIARRGKTIGVDYSEAMLSAARRSLGETNNLIELRLGYLEHLPIADSSADCAAAFMVLHHLERPWEAISDAARVLKPQGKFLIVDHCKHSGDTPSQARWLGFDEQEIQQWLKQSGFTSSAPTRVGDSFLLEAVR